VHYLDDIGIEAITMTRIHGQLHSNVMSLLNQDKVLSAPGIETSLLRELEENRKAPGSKETISLDSLVEDVAGIYSSVARKNLQRVITSTQVVASIQGNAGLLAHGLSILLFNAIESTPLGGLILLTLEPQADAIVITVSDTSLGMSSAERNRAVNESIAPGTRHTEDNPGVYRLQVVNAIARLHSAELRIGDNNPGLHVELRF